MMGVLVTGATTWTDLDALRREFLLLPKGSVIVTGDTPGVDAGAMRVAAAFGLQVESMKKNRADASAYPGASWKGLNERMLASGIDLVLAFHADYGKPGFARGTGHAISLAEEAGVAVRIFRR